MLILSFPYLEMFRENNVFHWMTLVLVTKKINQGYNGLLFSENHTDILKRRLYIVTMFFELKVISKHP